MSRSCIVAIDFGTAYSGCSYCLTVNHKEVQCVKRWERGGGADTAKTPTCILFDQNQEFMEFGYKARDKYYEICKNTNTYFYFKDFKMELYKQRITKDLVIKDVNKKPMSAMKVFSAALRFLKEDALKTLDKETQDLDLLDFTWVLTVPAIWDNPARQFMREAAEQAGLDRSSHRLVMALESEAASVWCKHLSADDFLLDSDDTAEVTMSAGTQYVVVDCGGGTIDITAHQVLVGGALKELHKASGNDRGGRTLDRKFSQCLRQFFCDGLWEEFEREHPKEAQQVMEDFTSFRQTSSHVRLLDFGVTFRDMIEIRRKKSKYPLFTIMDGLTFHLKPHSVRLEISERRMESFFHKMLVDIAACLSEILQNHRTVRYILLVGGLSSSQMLRERVQREFRDRAKVLCPKNPQEVVLKGALMFGRDQSVIRSRKSAFTCGFSKIMRFDPSKHKAEKRIETEDGVWCRHLFRKMVEVDEDVGWNETREFSIYPLESDQRKMSFDFYRTTKKDPTYVDEEEVEGPVALCDVTMPTVSKGLDHEVKLKICFGSTIITAEATDVQTSSAVSVTMDFKSYPVSPPAPPPSNTVPSRSSPRSSSMKHPSVRSSTPTTTPYRQMARRSLIPAQTDPPSTLTNLPMPSDQPTITPSRPTARRSFRLWDVAPPSKQPPVPSDPSPTNTRPSPQKPRPRDTPVPSDQPKSTRPTARRSSRPAQTDPPSTLTYPPSDQPTPACTRPTIRQSFRSGDVDPPSKPPPVPRAAYAHPSPQQKFRPREMPSSPSDTRPPVESDPTSSSTHPAGRRSSRPGQTDPSTLI